jgi:hypothetical protein
MKQKSKIIQISPTMLNPPPNRRFSVLKMPTGGTVGKK